MASLARPTDEEAPAAARPEATDNGYAYGSFPVYDNALSAAAAAAADHPSTNNDDDSGRPRPKPTPSTRALAPDLARGLLMVVMALDHSAIALHTWSHGTGRGSEQDGLAVRRWNRPAAYAVRTLTHLCAPGFTLLLGMGVVYLARSRARLGWSPGRLARYFALRAAVLTAVSVVFGLVVSRGQIWFLNMVLFALAVDYFLAGVLYLAVVRTEGLLTGWLAKVLPPVRDPEDDDGIDEPLLPGRGPSSSVADAYPRAESLSWHIHNAVLLGLSIVTICWNIWLSPDHGHCRHTSSTTMLGLEAGQHTGDEAMPFGGGNPWLRIWFWPVTTQRVASGFPPLAWLSFAILGVLYGRVVMARQPWGRVASAAGHLLFASLFALVFVLTRVLRVGDLSEGCLQTPDQDAHPDKNPYLVSVASFMYVVKYPPDVAFWAFTMAGNLVLLAVLGAIPPRVSKRFTMLLDFGTTALFFYVLHILLVFLAGAVLVALFGYDTGVSDPMDPGNTRGIDKLWAYFVFWAVAMLVLWPVCRWYSRFKSTKPADSLWRFF